MENTITLTGKILFEPSNRTKKHNKQASWKKIAMVIIGGDECELYQYFIKQRYGLQLNKPLRGSHISFINDRFTDIKGDTTEDKELLWETVKTKWGGKEISIVLNISPRSDGETWWLNVLDKSNSNLDNIIYRLKKWFNLPHEPIGGLQDIRSELGLGSPYFDLHMSIGYASHLQEQQSKYIHDCIKKGLIIT